VNIPKGNTCGVSAASGADIYIGTQKMGSINFAVSGGDLTGSLNSVALLEPLPRGTAPTGQMAPGDHTIKAVLKGVNSNYSNTDPTTTITIRPEDARSYYTGALYVGTTSATSTNAVITLSATVKDITAAVGDPSYDSYAGDIRNATVTFVNRDAGNAVIAQNVPLGLVNPADPKVAVATYNWNVTISGNAQVFTVGVIIGNYYTRNSSSEDVIITVAQPVPNTVTGGGFLLLSSAGGLKAGDIGSKENFGFNAKYNGSGKQVLGGVNIIIRKTESNVLHTYQVKCNNQLTSLAIQPSVSGGTATLNGKAIITDITNPASSTMVDNNATLQLNIADNGNPGTNDQLAVTIWNKAGGLWYASNWNGTRCILQTIAGGNEVIHGNNSITKSVALPEENSLLTSSPSCKVYPNPSKGQYLLELNSVSETAYSIRLTDLAGAQIFAESLPVAKGVNRRAFDLPGLAAGVYIMTVENGNNSQRIKIVIQR